MSVVFVMLQCRHLLLEWCYNSYYFNKTRKPIKILILSCCFFVFSSPAKSELLPPFEECLAQARLPMQLSHLKLSRSQSNSTPSTPEMRVHRQLSLRYHISVTSAYIVCSKTPTLNILKTLIPLKMLCVYFDALAV